MNNKLVCFSLLCFFTLNLNGCNKIKERKDINYIDNPKLNLSTKNIVNYLCSKDVKNRYIECDGNRKSVSYVESIFKDLNLEYVFSKSYLHSFKYKTEDYSLRDNKLIVKEIKLNNVVGKIRGENNKKAIILTAHIDSFGKGALDNGSGVGCVLKICEILKKYSLKKSFNYDVIFCITNGEMQLFKGSEAFLKDIKRYYDKLYNVNIDCIGLKNGQSLALKNISKVKESSMLYTSLKRVLKENNIDFTNTISTLKAKKAFKMNFGVSDYFTFERNGIPNIHIAQSGIEPLPKKENDPPETLDFNKIDKIAKGIAEWIKEFK